MDATTTFEHYLLFMLLIGFLLFWYFRMADYVQPKKHAPQVRRPSKPVADPADASLMSDPDGRAWK